MNFRKDKNKHENGRSHGWLLDLFAVTIDSLGLKKAIAKINLLLVPVIQFHVMWVNYFSFSA